MSDLSLPLAERQIAVGSNLPFTPGGPNQFINLNGTGQVKFGPINDNVATIYAMSTNNGIQAFQLTLEVAIVNNGDYNQNGTVDAADYVVWRDTQGLAAMPPGSGADGDGDGTIGPGDYSYWAQRFGNVIGPAIATNTAAPEPNGFGLVLLAAAYVALGRTRHAVSPNGSSQ
jgi:hypothetical protein